MHEIAVMCRFYGWTYDYVINLPFGVFNALLAESYKIRAEENLDRLVCQHTGKPQFLLDRYRALMDYGTEGKPTSDEEALENWHELGKFMTTGS